MLRFTVILVNFETYRDTPERGSDRFRVIPQPEVRQARAIGHTLTRAFRAEPHQPARPAPTRHAADTELRGTGSGR